MAHGSHATGIPAHGMNMGFGGEGATTRRAAVLEQRPMPARVEQRPRPVNIFGGRQMPSGPDRMPVRNVAKRTDDELRNQVHAILSDGIQELVEDIAHLEDTWSPAEIRKRVVRYLYRKPMAGEIVGKSWQEAVKKFVSEAASTYAGACQGKSWYEELDIFPVVARAAEAVADGCHTGFNPPRPGEGAELAKEVFEMTLHKAKVDQVLWEAVQAAFGADEKSAKKFFAALSKTYMISYEKVGSKIRRGSNTHPLARSETFISAWMGDAVGRAWGGVDDPDTTFTEATLTEFFALILTSDGIAENFTCLPPPLARECQVISLDGWADVLRPIAHELIERFNQPPSGKSKKRKRKTADGDEEDASDAEAEARS